MPYSKELAGRVCAAQERTALGRPHASPFDVTGKPMAGMVVVTSQGVRTDASLNRWVQEAVDFVATLPARTGIRK